MSGTKQTNETPSLEDRLASLEATVFSLSENLSKIENDIKGLFDMVGNVTTNVPKIVGEMTESVKAHFAADISALHDAVTKAPPGSLSAETLKILAAHGFLAE